MLLNGQSLVYMTRSHKFKKTIIYILGAGRSGTTILGIALGDENNIYNAGELNNFYEYKGVPPNDVNNLNKIKFFKNVYNSLDNKNTKITRKFEYHLNFMRSIFGIYSNKDKNDYSKLQTQLFDKLYETMKVTFIVDSSKYPSRLIALNKYIEFNIHLIYIIRHPIGYLNSARKKNIEQPNQSFIYSLIYYFIINLMCTIAYKKHSGKKIKLRYENFINNPIRSIDAIEKTFNIRFDNMKHKLDKNIPFDAGNVFDGNRLRLQKNVILKQKINNAYLVNIKNIVMMLLNRWFY